MKQFAFAALLLLSWPSASDAEPCPAVARTSLYFANGINTPIPADAKDGLYALADALDSQGPIPSACLETNIAYNSSNGQLLDLFQSYQQFFADNTSQLWRWLSGLDPLPDWFQQQLSDLSREINVGSYVDDTDLQSHVQNYFDDIINRHRKVIIVAHSQGNFYANEAYNILTTGTAPVAASRLSVVAVATPAGIVAGNGPYTTLQGDLILIVPGSLPANTEPDGTPCVPPLLTPACHAFVGSYLTGTASRPRIVTHVESAIPPNVPPTAHFKLVVGSHTVFDGSGVAIRRPSSINDVLFTVDGSPSVDPDGEVQSWNWSVDGAPLDTVSAHVQVQVGVGSHIIELVALDDSGAQSPVVSAQLVVSSDAVHPVLMNDVFGGATTLATPSSRLYDYSVAARGSAVYVAWTEFVDSGGDAAGGGEVFLRVSEDYGATWRQPINVSETAGDSGHAQIVTTDGGAIVVWEEDAEDFSSASIVLRHFDLHAHEFGVPVLITTESQPGRPAASLILSGRTLYIAWRNADRDDWSVITADVHDGTVQQPPLTMSTNVDLTFAADDDHVYVAWSSGCTIEFRRSSDGLRSFDVLRRFQSVGGSPRMVAAHGGIVLTWLGSQDLGDCDNHGNGRVLMAGSPDAGVTFGIPTAISLTPPESLFSLGLSAIDFRAGAVWIASSFPNGQPNVVVGTTLNWGFSTYAASPLTSFSSVGRFALDPRIVGGANTLGVAWWQCDNGPCDVANVYYAEVGFEVPSFQTIVTNVTNDGQTYGPEMAADDGHVYLIWQNYLTGQLFFSSSTSGIQ